MTPEGGPSPAYDHLTELAPLVRRVVAARVRDQPQVVDDLVQETLVRVLGRWRDLDEGARAPYAVVTARNLVSSLWQREDVGRRHAHRLLELGRPPGPEESLLAGEESAAVAAALQQLSNREREALLAHEVDGRDTRSLAADWDSTSGAVAAQLARARARLRVEYLLALSNADPPTSRCRPVLLALSAGDRRRQRELEAGRHLLECAECGRLSEQLLDGRAPEDAGAVRVPVRVDADIVAARQRGRELAADLGFPLSECTLIATAISEVARNIVRFADHGEIVLSAVQEPAGEGIRIVARDSGPGIADVTRAMHDGYSTYGGMGLGLPGSRRLMDSFEIVSEVGKGTTVTMTKLRGGR